MFDTVTPSKQGRHGRLYLYQVTIDPIDPGQPRYDVRRWAYGDFEAWDAAREEIEGPEWGDRVYDVRRFQCSYDTAVERYGHDALRKQ